MQYEQRSEPKNKKNKKEISWSEPPGFIDPAPRGFVYRAIVRVCVVCCFVGPWLLFSEGEWCESIFAWQCRPTRASGRYGLTEFVIQKASKIYRLFRSNEPGNRWRSSQPAQILDLWPSRYRQLPQLSLGCSRITSETIKPTKQTDTHLVKSVDLSPLISNFSKFQLVFEQSTVLTTLGPYLHFPGWSLHGSNQ